MTHTSTRLTHVLFGVVVTLVVAVAPVLFVVTMGQGQAADQSEASRSGSASVLTALDFTRHESLVFLVAGLAVVALLSAVFISTRVERDR